MRNRWKRLLCFLFFHSHFVVVHECSRSIRRIFCIRCERSYGMNDGVRAFLPWSDELCVCIAVDAAMLAAGERKDSK